MAGNKKLVGTLINFAAIIMGSVIGCFLKKGIPENINKSVLKAEGLVIALIGLNGVLGSMLYIENGRIKNRGGLLLLILLVAGVLIGEFLRLDDHVNNFGLMIEKKYKADGFAAGFVTASLVFCIGSLAIMGPINEVVLGDKNILYIKSMLDGVTSIVLASSLGIGVLFSSVPVLILQGGTALIANVISPFMTGEFLDIFCMIGYSIVICIGLNFLADTKVKTMNMMPALLVSVLYYFLVLPAIAFWGK